MGRVPQEHKDRANEHLEGTKNWFSEEYFPEERRDQFIYRAKKVIVECQRHDDYQASIKWLLGYFEEYFRARTERRPKLRARRLIPSRTTSSSTTP